MSLLRAASAQPNEAYSNLRLRHHRIGTKAETDQEFFGAGLAASPFVDASAMPRASFASSAFDMVVFDHGVEDPLTIAISTRSQDLQARRWVRIASPSDGVLAATLHGESVYVLTFNDAPMNRVERWRLRQGTVSEREVLFESSQIVLRSMVAAKDGLYVSGLNRGTACLFFLSFENLQPTPIKLPFDGALGGLEASAHARGAVFRLEGWTTPPRWFVHDTATGADPVALEVGGPSPTSFDDVVVSRLEVRSHDGVLVPVTLLHQRHLKRDGSNPTWLSAYGSYGIPLSPSYKPIRKAWLERGGVFAFAHVRGGGELGEPWHKAGQKANKKNSILDLIACAQQLINEGYASPKTLAVWGASAGGIVANGALVRRPDLFAAAVVDVGDANMLRLEQTPGGPHNANEFGSVKTREGFQALLEMDAYHQVKDGTPYPAVLFSTGVHDPRVPPWQSAKMAARLQAATSSDRPILVRVAFDDGHGVGSPQKAEAQRYADFYAFLLSRLRP